MALTGLIPARGGSRGIPRKNLVTLGGRPLIEWTIEVALKSPDLDRVIVSTDDRKIAEVAERAGAEVPALRPAALATDEATDQDVYGHVVRDLTGGDCEALVWLRPTSPFRRCEDVAGAIEVFRSTGADLVRSLCEVEHHPYWMKRLEGSRLEPVIPGHDERHYPRRQVLPPFYRLNGAVDIFRRRTLAEGETIYDGEAHGFVMPPERSVDIDTPEDLAFARVLLGEGGAP